MSFQVVPVSKHRQVVNDLLDRALVQHASVSATAEYDVTALRQQLRNARRGGAAVSLSSYLVKATATLIREQPNLNQHMFMTWWGSQRIVRFDDIHCTLVLSRRHEGEDLLLPLVVRHADQLSISEIEAIVHHHKVAPLTALAPMQALERIKRTPRIGLKIFSWRARTNPNFYLQTFGTYGLSSMVRQGGHTVAGASVANTGVAFIPGSLRKMPRLVGGQVVARDVLAVGFVFDHYLFDGIAMVRAIEGFAKFLERPPPAGWGLGQFRVGTPVAESAAETVSDVGLGSGAGDECV